MDLQRGRMSVFITYADMQYPFLRIWAQLDLVKARQMENSLAKLTGALRNDIAPPPFDLSILCKDKLLFVENDEESETRWYRAKIVNCDPVRKTVKVLVIDYGNCLTVTADRLRITDRCSDILKLPGLATECDLYNVLGKNSAWSKDAVKYVSDNLCYEEMTAEVKGYRDTIPQLQIYTDPGHKHNFSERLVSLGHADFRFGQPSPVPSSATTPTPQQPFTSAFYTPAASGPPMMSSGAASIQPSSVGPSFRYERRSVDERKGSLCIVSHVENPDKFFVHLISHREHLNDLMKTIQTHCALKQMSTLPKIAVGMPCLFLFDEGNLWYRGLVTDVFLDSVMVQCVDYGNVERVKSFTVRALPIEFAAVAPFAIECQLHGVECPGVWTEDEIQPFTGLVVDPHIPKNFHLVVRGKSDDVPLSVELFNQQRKSISQIFGRLTNTLSSNQTLGNPTPMVSSAAYSTLPSLTGTTEAVEMVYFDEHHTKIFVQLIKMKGKLESMQDNLQSIYGNPRSVPMRLDEMLPMSPCVAQSPEDEQWYRAEILTGPRNQMVSVRFVDYGDVAIVNCSAVKPLHEQLLSTPVMGVCCYLQSSPRPTPFEAALFNDYVGVVVMCSFGPLSSEAGYSVKLIPSQPPSSGNLQRRPSPVPRREEGLSEKLIPGLPTIKASMAVHRSFDGIVSHVRSNPENLGEFYVQLPEFKNKIESLTVDLQQFYATPVQRMINPVKNQLLAAKYVGGDDCWYRAVLLDRKGPNVIEVLFIDYGNTEQLSLADVCPLDKRFKTHPPMAFACGLYNANVNARNAEKLIDLVEGKGVFVTLEGFHLSGQQEEINDVTVVRTVGGKDYNINDIIAGRSNNVPPGDVVRPEPVKSIPPSYGRPDPTGRSGGFGGREANDRSEVNGSVPPRSGFSGGGGNGFGSNGYNNNRREGDAGGGGKSFGSNSFGTNNRRDGDNTGAKGFGPSSNGNSSHVGGSAPPWGSSAPRNESARPVVDASIKLRRESPFMAGKAVEVSCSYVTDPNNLCLQVAGQMRSLQDLMSAVGKSLENSPADPSFKPAKGESCVAMYSEDFTWYRAEVKEVRPGGQFVVEYVDYGNLESVGQDKLRRMKPEWAKDPVFGHVLGLPLAPVEGSVWSTDESDQINQELANAESMQAELISNGKPYVKLIVNGVDYAADLIAKGLAKSLTAIGH